MEEEIFWFVRKHYEETLKLLKELAEIPAPSGREEKRAEFILRWLEKQGAAGAYLDDVGNVVFPYRCEENKPVVVIMAHMDLVCPDQTKLQLTENNECLIGPGIRDNTANLVNMLMCIKFLLDCQMETECGLLFVADVCEEGLGNLKGSRQIWKDHHEQIREWICYDLNYDLIYNRAVGSQRYRVTIKTTGGHSYQDFGNENAIVQLSEIISELYRITVPKEPKVTFNVGEICGGTSVNTIAQEASMLYEFRSESTLEMKKMEKFFESVLQKYREKGVDVKVDLLGTRPGNGEIAEAEQQALERRCLEAVKNYYDGEVVFAAGSTDGNIPLSYGVPAITVGTALGGGTHTRQEWVVKKSMETGQMIALSIICSYRQKTRI